MKSKKNTPKKSGIRAFTWFLFSVFLVVSFFCIKYIKQVESQNNITVDSVPVTVVHKPSNTVSKAPIQKVTPQTKK
jgi:hypothetical protein